MATGAIDNPKGNASAPRAVRPRNRRALILAAASDLFSRHGYTRVGVSDIAEAVGIGPSALYRHFAGKQQLLMQVVLGHLEPFQAVLDDVDSDDPHVVARKLAAIALDTRPLGLLWQRESRHLPRPQRDELKEQLRGVATKLAGLTRAHRPELTDQDARFRAWCLFSALTSLSYHHVEMRRGRFEELVGNVVTNIVAQPPLEFSERGEVAAARSSMVERTASRRRLLLAAATRLFAEHGYGAVTTEDIGAAVGIAGPSVYNHFATKQELLNTVITRGSSWLEIELERTLSAASGTQDALQRLLGSYIGFATGHGEFIDMLVSEVDHLPDFERHRARQVQREYISEWVALLREVRPELNQPEARVLVQAAVTLANDMARTGLIRDPGAVGQVGKAIMLTTRPPRS